MDWSSTPLGPVRAWPAVLRTSLLLCLDSGFPITVNWGPDQAIAYNDAYVPLLGPDKHPEALGRLAKEIWPEAWHVTGPMVADVMRTGRAIRGDDMEMILHPNGYPEECYFTFSHGPLRDADGSIVGIFTVAAETTGHVLSERRLWVMQQLGALSATDTGTTQDTCRAALAVMQQARASVPFAVAFLDEDVARGGDTAGIRAIAHYGLAADAGGTRLTEPGTDAASARCGVTHSGKTEVITGLRERLPGALLPGPLGDLPPDEAVILPLTVSGGSRPVGALAIGVNPYRRLDAEYHEFFAVVGRQLSIALTDSLAYEGARRRAQALTEIDQAKTEFFQNVSHEFRTPLTLLLAPLQCLPSEPGAMLSDRDREAVGAAVRAAQRLERLVEALLDFARAEAGVLTPNRKSTDLARLTADVAAMFRSAAEDAGLRFQVDVPRTPVTANVDRSMWSTIVTNLVSNAVKYTAAGVVTVRVAQADDQAVLSVTDSGKGIAVAEQRHIFDRFYRSSTVDGADGAGIGLALVADLTKVHDGRVELISSPGRGSTFTVTVPRGTPGDVESPETGVHAVSDALHLPPWWERPPAAQPDDLAGAEPAGNPAAGRWLLVEDDDDLRAFLTRLLTDDGWTVQAVGDADAAMAHIGGGLGTPDLVLSDVVLPGRSGIDLLRRLRRTEACARVPIILLTGRGGADAASEGLAAGADDYITKPFAPQELLARIRVHHELHQLREYALSQAENQAEQLQNALASNRVVGAAIGILMQKYLLTNAQACQLMVKASQHTNRKLRDLADRVVETGALPVPDGSADGQVQRAVSRPKKRPNAAAPG